MKGLVRLCNTTIHSNRKLSNFQTRSVSERLQSSLEFHITHLLIGDISESIKVLHILYVVVINVNLLTRKIVGYRSLKPSCLKPSEPMRDSRMSSVFSQKAEISKSVSSL